jgi:hypothetical protein
VRCIAKLDAIQLTGIVIDEAFLRLHRSRAERHSCGGGERPSIGFNAILGWSFRSELPRLGSS